MAGPAAGLPTNLAILQKGQHDYPLKIKDCYELQPLVWLEGNMIAFFAVFLKGSNKKTENYHIRISGQIKWTVAVLFLV